MKSKILVRKPQPAVSWVALYTILSVRCCSISSVQSASVSRRTTILADEAGQPRASVSQQGLLQKSGTEKEGFLSRCGVLLSVGTALLAWLKCVFTLCNLM